jgi:hypothetical protein
MKMGDLKRIFSPLFWEEKSVEYAIQDIWIEPSREAKIKSIGYEAIKKFLHLLGIPALYDFYKSRDPKTFYKMKENVRNSLLEKGYPPEKIRFEY